LGELYSEEIEVLFELQPLIEKRPGLPYAFTWRGKEYVISELLEEWHDYRPRGRSKSMYEKERGAYWVKSAEKRGSWGVGRDCYRVRVDTGEVFDIYYDRKPKGSKAKGIWVLYRRVKGSEPPGADLEPNRKPF
jgi:hypothetical protein